MVTLNSFLVPIRFMVISTGVPFFPLSFSNTCSFFISYASSPLILTILSPGCRPARSEGLSATGVMTVMSPFKISRSIPIP